MINTSKLRIIDANYNRIKEAIRVLEDISRFYLIDKNLTKKYRKLRHTLDNLIDNTTAYVQMINSRAGNIDPGKNFYTNKINDIYAVSIANSQRIQEALRVLEEIYKTTSIKKSNICMKLRFESYDIAKELLSNFVKKKLPDKFLYIIGNYNDWFTDDLYKKILEQKLFLVQFRDDIISDSLCWKHLTNFIKYAHNNNVKVIINNRADLCYITNADGIHIGKNDLPPKIVKNIIGHNKYIGYTTHNINELIKADNNPDIDYLSFGTIFKSFTKPGRPFYGEPILETLRKIKLQKDLVLIGGINLENIDIIVKNGFKKIAVSNSIFKSNNPLAAIDKFLNKLHK